MAIANGAIYSQCILVKYLMFLDIMHHGGILFMNNNYDLFALFSLIKRCNPPPFSSMSSIMKQAAI